MVFGSDDSQVCLTYKLKILVCGMTTHIIVTVFGDIGVQNKGMRIIWSLFILLSLQSSSRGFWSVTISQLGGVCVKIKTDSTSSRSLLNRYCTQKHGIFKDVSNFYWYLPICKCDVLFSFVCTIILLLC